MRTKDIYLLIRLDALLKSDYLSGFLLSLNCQNVLTILIKKLI